MRDCDEDGLTAPQRAFVTHYLKTYDPGASYLAAKGNRDAVGTSPLAVMGHMMLRTPSVNAAIRRAMNIAARQAERTAKDVILEIAEIAFGDPTELAEVHVTHCDACWPDDAQRIDAPNPECRGCWGRGRPVLNLQDTRTISPKARKLLAGYEVTSTGQLKVKLNPKMAALEMLGRVHGIFSEDNRQRSLDPLVEFMRNIAAGKGAQQGPMPLPIADSSEGR